ncbi:MAG: 3-ketoacyl-ACP reductase, partial [Cytophagaceae bacterium SCN 52-12]
GGSRGIGLGIAHSLARAGYNLIINGVRPEADVRETLEELGQHGVKVVYARGSVSSEEDRESMIRVATEAFGSINVLVNNAGVAPKQRLDLLETTRESYRYVTETNLEGPFFLTQAIARHMAEKKAADPEFEASIVFVTSISSTVASINRGEYCISKAGLSMVSSLFAVRMAEHEIPVYEIRPGVIATDMTAKVQSKYDQLFEGGMALQRRWGTPEDVGKAVAAVVTGSFPYSTGQVILVDGGMNIQRL